MNTRTILRNTVWFALENVISFVASLITSILIARTLGPSRMGYIVYVLLVINIAATLGGLGVPATTRKYMAELLAGGDSGSARHVYLRTLWFQMATASVITLGCVVWVLLSAPVEYRWASLLLVLSVWPGMVNSISAFANVAREDLSANVPASAASTLTFFIVCVLTVVRHWGVMGVAASMLTMRMVDFLVRFVPTFLRIQTWKEMGGALPADLPQRMRTFAVQSVASMLVTFVVWDRSEVVLLKHFSQDIRQVAFYSVAFSLAERLLVFPTVFASATGTSMLAQYGRDRTRVPAMAAASARYLGLTSIPLHFIATALAGAALVTMYGNQYLGAVTVAMAAPLLCLPKAFLTPVQTLFEAVERQSYFIWATLAASVIDICIAVLMIPRHGALGAAIGSGVAQAICVAALWTLATRRYHVRLPWRFFGKVSLISAASGLAGYLPVMRMQPAESATMNVVLTGAGTLLAIATFLLLAGALRMFEQEDLSRFKVLVESCPAALAAPVNLTYSWLNRRVAPTQTEELL